MKFFKHIKTAVDVGKLVVLWPVLEVKLAMLVDELEEMALSDADIARFHRIVSRIVRRYSKKNKRG